MTFAQTLLLPVIVPAGPAPVVIDTAVVVALLVPHTFVPVTDTVPPVEPKSTTMLDPVDDPLIVAPLGTVQLYVVTLGSDGTLYTMPVSFAHTPVGPVMVPGVDGALPMVMLWVFVTVPQLPSTSTLMAPSVLPMFTVMLSVPWPVLIVVPVGTLHT